MIPTWVKALLALVIVAGIYASILAYGQQQFSQGEKAESARWLKRENAELTTTNAKLKTLEEQYRLREQQHAEQLAAASKKYQEELHHAKIERDHLVADLRTGDLRLYIGLATTAQPAGGNYTTPPITCTSGRDGETRCELSRTSAEFLVGLASECNEVVHQLNAAQDIIAKDRSQP